jgi:hypothetical protein
MKARTDELEQEVLEMLLAGTDPVLETLRQQLTLSAGKPREMSGAGFFRDFQPQKEARRLTDAPSFSFGDVMAEIEGLAFGAGFVLHVREGLIDFLEGYSYEEPWPANVVNYKLSYINGPTRDLNALRATRGWPSGSERAP